MTSLPPELVIHVLELAFYNDDGSINRETMSAASLVCRTWQWPGQKLLFHNVRAATSGRRIVPPPVSTAHFIRRLDINIINQGQFEGFINVLAQCEKLYELTFRVQNVHSFDSVSTEQLKMLSGKAPLKSIASLNLMTFGIQSPIPYQLLSLMPGVRFLRLGMELGLLPPPQPPAFKLQELSLLRTPSLKVTEWLVSGSVGHLRVLEFRDPPPKSFDGILSIHGPYLQSIRLFHHTVRSKAIFELCPNVEELIIYLLSAYLPFRSLPKGLKHFSFRNYSWAENVSLFPVLQAIDMLPQLQLVSCDPNAEKHIDMPDLIEECRQKGIELEMGAAALFVFEDPVPIRKFPRRRSVSNFQYMNPTVLD